MLRFHCLFAPAAVKITYTLAHTYEDRVTVGLEPIPDVTRRPGRSKNGERRRGVIIGVGDKYVTACANGGFDEFFCNNS